MCFFDHCFAHIFLFFNFVAKPMLQFRENMMFFRTVIKSSNYNYLSRRKVFYRRTGIMTKFSAAWYLSIVSQAAKATYIRTQSMQYNFASLCIEECSTRAVVAAHQIKAMELDVFLHIELLQFLLFAHSIRRSFLRTVQSIQQYGSTE